MKPRVIPVLLLDSKKRLVKTVEFDHETYIGDPFNVIRIFNEKEVDEICILDIYASVDGRKPDRGFVAELAAECFMPLGYGGGIATPADAEHLFSVGIEKVVIGEHAGNAVLTRSLAEDFGSQAIAACIDCRATADGYTVFTRRGTRRIPHHPKDYAQRLEAQGVGEIVVQSIDRDGMRSGYDCNLVQLVAAAVGIPVVALGGAGEMSHMAPAINAGASAVASGSAFVFIGKLRAVLLNYPTTNDLEDLAKWLRSQ